jgi:hypothetical protein
MQVKAPRQFARAWQALAGSEVAPQNAQYDLCHKLLANADFTSPGKPKLHGRPC